VVNVGETPGNPHSTGVGSSLRCSDDGRWGIQPRQRGRHEGEPARGPRWCPPQRHGHVLVGHAVVEPGETDREFA